MRTETGTNARSLHALGANATRDQIGAQRTGHHCQDDIVDRSTELVLDQLEILQPAGHAHEPPMWPDLHVQWRLGRWIQTSPNDLADSLGGLTSARQGMIGMRDRVQRSGGQLDACPHGRPHASQQQLDSARLAMWLPRTPGVPDRFGLGGEVEQHCRQVHTGDAVDQRVMGL